ncbi:hypothetical protein [Moraxella catarrhalis]|jgi:hypothetical protein|uniref:hypothetical protein n=1 Tax=Moraxella catarrhalis TaxID=480 RepID=UPI0009C371D4|nr:hypothetical protein [Moraxella catarrhalis]ARE66971.1 hypothetical protein MC195_09340 [Moraxella catarrhalis]MPW68392.1 hypothetical protein [Moraxella catarrhalis]MPX27844.1 hypothetical protein [Moraxella catarrhalis]MPX57056.1 hypothetical protein [Moraxella catarrhalis]RKL79034.1 hypothetical protein D6D63_08340 [Moraxella catarrhalis]
MSKDAEYTKKYLQKRKTKRYAFDLYADDADELKLIELLDKAKADKQLKNVIKQALIEQIAQETGRALR